MLLTGKKKKKKTSLFFFLLIFGVKLSWKHSNIWLKPLRASVLTASYKLFKEEKLKLDDLAKTQLTQCVRFDALNTSDTLLIENGRRACYLQHWAGGVRGDSSAFERRQLQEAQLSGGLGSIWHPQVCKKPHSLAHTRAQLSHTGLTPTQTNPSHFLWVTAAAVL